MKHSQNFLSDVESPAELIVSSFLQEFTTSGIEESEDEYVNASGATTNSASAVAAGTSTQASTTTATSAPRRARSISTDSAGLSYHDLSREDLIKELKSHRRRNQELEESLEAAEREIAILHETETKHKQTAASESKPPSRFRGRWRKRKRPDQNPGPSRNNTHS